MEIEKKYLVSYLPSNLSSYPSSLIKQGYISTKPVIRIRQKDDKYYLTIKSKGHISREEYELLISKDEFLNLSKKIDTNFIEKRRYFIPLKNNLTAELDIYCGIFSELITVEVEFKSEEEMNLFTPPDWFGKDVSLDSTYKNASLASRGLPD